MSAKLSGLKGLFQPLLPILWPVLGFSAVFNVLLLSGSFFMLLVYDDVLASRSVPTLAGLLLMVAVAYAFQAALDIIRNRVLFHSGAMADRQLSARVYDVLSRFGSEAGRLPSGAAPVRDLDMVRNYIAGPGPLALLDLPYVAMFLVILTMFHWALGLTALVGALALILLMAVSAKLTNEPARDAATMSGLRFSMAEDIRRRSETIRVLGMGERRRAAWDEANQHLLTAQDRLSEISGRMQGISKTFRQFLQSLMLAVGALLVIEGEATGGIIVAGSILGARALMPVEQTIAHWKSMVDARQALERLAALQQAVPQEYAPMPLPRPKESLEVQQLTSRPPGMKAVTLANVNFRLNAGEALAVIGHSGSGKSTLMRSIVGAWQPLRGSVRLDGAALDQWSPADLGRDIGYVSQRIELFEGTIGQNIARFDPAADPEAIIAAARQAGVHEMIVALPGGYDYQLGPGGDGLSEGQQQRLALARALYGDPFLIVLDEANSNLDAQGEQALAQAVLRAKERGAIVIIVGHRPSVFAHVDHILVMAGGEARQMGPRDEMLKMLGLLRVPAAANDGPRAAAAG
ncbi:type I secretion protein [Altererythrobacter sp. B11]|uniref:type I secretion system permease/ATPase n=1 Tax=Altererythrobacter sp. B11 TaxID=2060312 RepID=UPI000DC7107B|nr:type I secretion system permease/ATPase [Altererythrobacter sp. B11]BBC70976.1 type I secretion protein [Altererythrobacter sp. B11]